MATRKRRNQTTEDSPSEATVETLAEYSEESTPESTEEAETAPEASEKPVTDGHATDGAALARKREDSAAVDAAKKKKDAEERAARTEAREKARDSKIAASGLVKARVVGPGSYHLGGKQVAPGTEGKFPARDVEELECLEAL